MASDIIGLALNVESNNGVLHPFWDLCKTPLSSGVQIDEDWFSRGSAFWGYGLWIFNVVTHFLMLVLLNTLLGEFLALNVDNFKGDHLKTLGQGLVYLIAVPVLAVYCVVTILGFPFGLLLLATYLLSIWLGDCLAALLFCHLLNSRNERSWNFWTIVLLSLGIVIAIDLLILFPVLGILTYTAIIAYTYGIYFNLVKQTYLK